MGLFRRRRKAPPAALCVALAARPALAALTQAAVARGRLSDQEGLARWWTVWGSVVDVGSLGLLSLLTRHEGIALKDLAGVDPRRLARDLRLVPVALVGLAPALGLNAVLVPLLERRSMPAQLQAGRLPPAAAAYSVLVWPALWAPAEELTYLGYALPRLEAWIGRGPAAAVVSLVWAAQHLALPFIPDGRYLLSRLLTALTVTGSMTAGYLLNGRRLLPLIVAHWLGDLGTAAAVVSVGRRSGGGGGGGDSVGPPPPAPAPPVTPPTSQGLPPPAPPGTPPTSQGPPPPAPPGTPPTSQGRES